MPRAQRTMLETTLCLALLLQGCTAPPDARPDPVWTPADSVVTIEFDRAGATTSHPAVVVADGALLVASLGSKPIEAARVRMPDGRTHDVTGVLATDWSTSLALLEVRWSTDAPPDLLVVDVDHLEMREVAITRHAGVSIRAQVQDVGVINATVIVQPDDYYDMDGWYGAAVIDEQGRLLAVVTSWQMGGTFPPKITSIPTQTFGCAPGAWIARIAEHRRLDPIGWEDWPQEVESRKTVRRMVEQCAAEDDPAKSLALCDAVIARAPTNAEAWKYKAYALYSLDRMDEALVAAQTSMQFDPDEHYTAVLLANIACDLNQISLAQQSTKRAMRMAHRSVRDHYIDARIAHKSRLRDEAMRSIARVLEIDPDHEGALQLKAVIDAEDKARGL